MSDEADTNAGRPEGLGRYLKSVRLGLDLSLRDVEEATGKEVSNAYLSQLETGKINKPSPHILYALSTALTVPYETLMERAGYIAPNSDRAEGAKHGKAATFSIENLSADEEQALMDHLAYIRWQRNK
ncbi:MAG: helix-turn-helix transcriptional regulator [Sphingomonas sp.]|uniref:helix-turn-helix domain-containing protein n=1 Tax=Sphingomonas sp. TaxID=28214 RepID=UPI001AD55201|nr:helix-turn-helix transcriptional regulator [Sphingomonas sp.]MBN8807018.1 helix-turn-helix transcriptional regulator [Sphingomonas sp.]